MSDNKKQERDFTPEVDALLPEAIALAKAGIFILVLLHTWLTDLSLEW